jgi:hypothetical protein
MLWRGESTGGFFFFEFLNFEIFFGSKSVEDRDTIRHRLGPTPQMRRPAPLGSSLPR